MKDLKGKSKKGWKARIKTLKDNITVEKVLENIFHADLDTDNVICCPLKDHDDSSPSFSLYSDHPDLPGHEKWKCYGCNRNGDIIDLAAYYLMDEVGEKADFKESINLLETKFGLSSNLDISTAKKLLESQKNKKKVDRKKKRNKKIFAAAESSIIKKTNKLLKYSYVRKNFFEIIEEIFFNLEDVRLMYMNKKPIQFKKKVREIVNWSNFVIKMIAMDLKSIKEIDNE